MKICHVSTFWPNKLGLTHYTDMVIRGIRANRPEQHLVLGEGPTTEAAETEAYRCVPCWDRRDDYVAPVVRAAREHGADVAIVQYANDVCGDDDRIVRLLAGLRAEGIRSAAFCHSVYRPQQRTAFGTAAGLDRAMADAADCLIVHTNRMRRDLLDHGVPASKIAVIPHGTEIIEPPDQRTSRLLLRLDPDEPVVLFFGFVWLGKGLDFLLDVFARVVKQLPRAQLYIGGYTRHKKLYTHAYMAYLRARQWQLGIARRTVMWGDYVPDEVVSSMYAAADVVAMPYKQDYSSASGVVHQTVGFGRLPLCSAIAKFDEVGEVAPDLCIMPSHDRDQWVTRLVRLLGDEGFAAEQRRRTRAWAEATSWPRVGQLHLRLYDGLVAGASAAEAMADAPRPDAAAG